MLTVRVDRGKPPENWDRNIASAGLGGVFQTSRWACLVRALRGSEPLYISLSRGQNTAGQCLVLEEGEGSDQIRRSGWRPFLLPLVKWGLPTINWLNGPVFLERPGREMLERFHAEIEALAARKRVVSVSFSPFLPQWESETGDFWEEQGYQGKRQATYLVDLEDDFERRFHRSVRKNIRKCRSQGVVVDEIGKEDLREFYQLQIDFRRQMGLPGFSFEDFALHGEILGDYRTLFGARWEGKLVAGLGVLACNGLLIEVEAGTAQVCYERGIYAHDLLKAEIMQWGKERGFRVFDLAGVAVEPQNEKEEGIRRFKSKFGGQYVEFQAFCKKSGSFRNKVLDWARQRAQR